MSKEHDEFVRVLRKHELAKSADAGFDLPEADFDIVIEALKIAARSTKPKRTPYKYGSGFKYGYHGFE